MMAPTTIFNFDGDPETYNVMHTIGAVVTFWITNQITEDEMLVLLHQFRTMYETGQPSVPFMKDILRTSCWRHQSGFLSTECATPSKYKLTLIIAPIVITNILFISKAIHNVDLICSLLNMQCSVLFLGYSIIPR